jgi:CYTH domain-containing protein
MPTEIERKFLVTDDTWRASASAARIRQGYLYSDKRLGIRVRTVDDRAFLTIKGVKSGLVRAEYEYPIPVADAEEMLALCAAPLIDKTRYTLEHGGREWIVDVFAGENAGLIVAEVELEDADDDVTLPPWAGREVTDDPRYLNANLGCHPYRAWSSAV